MRYPRERVYLPAGKVAHYSHNDGLSVAFCGRWAFPDFWGTGSQEEYEEAARRRLCVRCKRKAGEA